MKKRTIRTIISVTVAVLVVCAMSVNAMADTQTVKVKVQSGETLTGICSRYGLYFPSCKDAIMRLNGFTDPRQLDRIRAGDVIVIPASSGDASTATQADGEQAAARSGPVPIVAGDASKAPVGDKASYYIVLYTVKSGDILTNLYRQWGMDFGQYQAQIMALNGLNNLDKLVVGKMLYLPVNRGDIAGMANYTIFEHTIAYGENVSGICGCYGLDFKTASASLQSFNPTMNFSNVYVGQKLYIPVTGKAAAPASVAASGAPAPVTAITSRGAVEPSPAPGTTPALPPLNNKVELPTSVVYDGYAVVKECNGYLSLVLEKPNVEFNVAYTQQTMQGYTPRPGDYVRVVFTPTDYLLVSIQYVYNVFTGK